MYILNKSLVTLVYRYKCMLHYTDNLEKSSELPMGIKHAIYM